MSEMPQRKWQPVVMIVDRRLECKCGALATFVTGKLTTNPDEYNCLDEVDVWCQACFVKAQAEQDELI